MVRLVLIAVLFVLSGLSSVSAADRPPNVVLILIDDMSPSALSCWGNRHVETDHIDRLAKEGTRFTSFYVLPQCTPTRAALLTGQNSPRNQMWHVIGPYGYPYAPVTEPVYREHLSRDTFTLAKGFKSAGYATGIAGKWHLTNNEDGHYVVLHQKASHHYGFDYSAPQSDPPGDHQRGDKGVDRLTDEAIGFMQRHKDKPFFLYLSHHTIHGPVLAPDALVEKYNAKGYPKEGVTNATYLAAIEHMDDSIGRLLAAIDDLKLRDDTIVLFLTDNGGVDTLFPSDPLRAGKGSIYEGGIRVPLIVRWPGKVTSGKTNDEPMHVVDLLPTLLEIAGAKTQADHVIDGQSLVKLWKGETKSLDRAIHFYLPLYDIRWGLTPCAAIRRGDLKLIEWFGDTIDLDDGRRHILGPRIEMYDVTNDIGETRDLSQANPEQAADLRKELRDWLKAQNAAIPGPNPNYDPARALLEVRGKQSSQ